MALPFVYREEAPARQAIAAMQVEAAAAENASRERIERERTASQRYATQAQLNDRDKDRAVAREDNALRRDIILANKNLDADKTRDAAAKDRARLQFATIVEKLNNNLADPPTKGELEALFAGAPDLTEDQKNAARSLRDDAFKQAKSNAAMGQRTANNYKAELKGKAATDSALPEIYTRLSKDPNVIFDRATGSVESAFRAPREDMMAPGTGPLLRPGTAAPTAGGIPTIADMQARVTGAPLGISPAQDYGGAAALPPGQSTITAQPSPALPNPSAISARNMFGLIRAPRESTVEIPPFIDMSDTARRVPVMSELLGPPYRGARATAGPEMMGPFDAGRPAPLSFLSTDIPPGSRAQRSTEIAPPFIDMSEPSYRAPAVSEMLGPPYRTGVFNGLPKVIDPRGRSGADWIARRSWWGPTPGPTPNAEDDFVQLTEIAKHPSFHTLSIDDQQWILDEVGRAYTRTRPTSQFDRINFPRASDLQTLRPEYAPMDPYYAPQ